GGLVLEAETVQVRRVRVVADAGTNGPGKLAAGLFVTARRNVSFSECEFLQGARPSDAGPFNSVAVVSAQGASPDVSFDRCAFLGGPEVQRPTETNGGGWLADVAKGGQNAVALKDVASASAENCAY